MEVPIPKPHLPPQPQPQNTPSALNGFDVKKHGSDALSLPPLSSVPPRPTAAQARRAAQQPETFWDRWGTIVMLVCTILIFAALAWFGYSVYSFVTKIETGERIDISQFALEGDSSGLNANTQSSTDTATDVYVDNYSDDPFFGNPNASVTIVMFEDFECPYCGRAFPILRKVMAKYSSQVKFVYRDFPLSTIHPNASVAAQAANCAHAQGKFWEYHDRLFQNQSALTTSDLKEHAIVLGLDETAFNSCVDTGEFADEVDRDFSDGLRAGVSGTPTFFVNGNRVQGVVSEEAFDQLIQYFLERS